MQRTGNICRNRITNPPKGAAHRNINNRFELLRSAAPEKALILKNLQTFRGSAAFLICHFTDLKKDNYGKQPVINHFCTLRIINFRTLLSYPGCCWICKILRTWYKSEPLIFHGFIAARKILALRFQFAKDEAAWFCEIKKAGSLRIRPLR